MWVSVGVGVGSGGVWAVGGAKRGRKGNRLKDISQSPRAHRCRCTTQGGWQHTPLTPVHVAAEGAEGAAAGGEGGQGEGAEGERQVFKSQERLRPRGVCHVHCPLPPLHALSPSSPLSHCPLTR